MEYVIMVPVLLLLLMVGLQLVILATDKIALSNAVFDAARARATMSNTANQGELAAIRDLARRRTRAATSQTSILNLDVSVSLTATDSRAVASASMNQDLLPLLKQAVIAVGGAPRVQLRETAFVPMESHYDNEGVF